MIDSKVIDEFLYEYNEKKDYFECHEIMEEAWKENCPKRQRNCDYVVLLQIAVCLHHLRNNNLSGATQMYSYIIKNIDKKVLSNLGKYFNENDIINILQELNFCIKSECYRHLYLRRSNEKI